MAKQKYTRTQRRRMHNKRNNKRNNKTRARHKNSYKNNTYIGGHSVRSNDYGHQLVKIPYDYTGRFKYNYYSDFTPTYRHINKILNEEQAKKVIDKTAILYHKIYIFLTNNQQIIDKQQINNFESNKKPIIDYITENFFGEEYIEEENLQNVQPPSNLHEVIQFLVSRAEKVILMTFTDHRLFQEKYDEEIQTLTGKIMILAMKVYELYPLVDVRNLDVISPNTY
jgi:hypothetical protein